MFLDKTALLFGICVAVLFSGCGSVTGPKFSEFKQPTNGNAMVYIYGNGGALSYTASYDNKNYNLGLIRNGFVRGMEIPSNKEVEIWTRTETVSSIVIDTLPNEIYCLKASMGMGWMVARPNLQKVDIQTCIQETKNLIDANINDMQSWQSYKGKAKFENFDILKEKSILYIIQNATNLGNFAHGLYDDWLSHLEYSITISNGVQKINLENINKERVKNIELIPNKKYQIYSEGKIITEFQTIPNQITCMISHVTLSKNREGMLTKPIVTFSEIGTDNCGYLIAEIEEKKKQREAEKQENDPRSKYGL